MLLLGTLTGSSDLRAVPGANFSNPNNPPVITPHVALELPD